MFDGFSFDPFPLFDDGRSPAEVGIGGRHVVQTKTAVPLRFPLGYMEKLPRMEKAEQQALRQRMRDLYAVHYSKLGKAEEETGAAEDPPAPQSETPTPPPGHIDTDASESW